MTLSKEDVVEKMKKPHVVLLNILSDEEFQVRHIRGSLNHPLREDQVGFALAVEKSFGRGKFFITYGSGPYSQEAMEASVALRKKGLWAEAYMGGLQEWEEAGFPITGARAPKEKEIK